MWEVWRCVGGMEGLGGVEVCDGRVWCVGVVKVTGHFYIPGECISISS